MTEYIITTEQIIKLEKKLERMSQAFDTIYNKLQEHTTDSCINTVVKFERAHLNCESILLDVRSYGYIPPSLNLKECVKNDK
jgi:hypothetical protein